MLQDSGKQFLSIRIRNRVVKFAVQGDGATTDNRFLWGVSQFVEQVVGDALR